MCYAAGMADALSVVMRWMHLVGVVLLVGGLVVMVLGVVRAKDISLETVQAIYRKVAGLAAWSVLLLSVSGVYQWVVLSERYSAIGAKAHALIGTKVLLATLLLAWAFSQVLNVEAGVTQGTKRSWWAMLGLALLVMLMGATVRQIRLGG